MAIKEFIEFKPIKCISTTGRHDFKVLHTTREQKYFFEDNNGVRDHWVEDRERLVCEHCGIDSDNINNPKLLINN